MKKIIMSEGWCKIFRCRKKSNKINPDGNDLEGNGEDVGNLQIVPIPTVSGNIKALSRQRKNIKNDLENDFMMLTANQLFANP